MAPRGRPRKVVDTKLFDSEAVKKAAEETTEPPEEVVEEQKVNEPEETPVVVKTEEKVEVKEDPALALAKQLEELKKSEALQKTRFEQAARERDEAIKRAQERETEIIKFRKDAEESQFDAINSALAAATSEAEKAQIDIENAVQIGDTKAQAQAYRILARAEANISRLEQGKNEIEEVRKAPPKQQETKAPEKPAGQLPDSAMNYLRSRPELTTDPKKWARLQGWHWDAVEAGNEAYSPAYYDFIDVKAGYKQAEVKKEVQEEQRTNIVSAPVSREAPTSDGKRQSQKMELSAAEVEAAKMSGITTAEYARQKSRLLEEKSRGNYTGGQ